MAKFYGVIGFSEQAEIRPGVWEEQITERKYKGDVIRNTKKNDRGEHLNDDLNVNNSIRILADRYAKDHLFAIRYIQWMGAKWKVTTVEVDPPRLTLTIGGVYNGAATGA